MILDSNSSFLTSINLRSLSIFSLSTEECASLRVLSIPRLFYSLSAMLSRSLAYSCVFISSSFNLYSITDFSSSYLFSLCYRWRVSDANFLTSSPILLLSSAQRSVSLASAGLDSFSFFGLTVGCLLGVVFRSEL